MKRTSLRAPKPSSQFQISDLNQEMQQCAKILAKIRENKKAAPFLYPVDPVDLCLPDYCTIVKKPMDLSTVSNKLYSGQYQTRSEFAADVQLIWDNCYLYNPKDTWIVQFAEEMEAFAKNLLVTIKKEPKPLEYYLNESTKKQMLEAKTKAPVPVKPSRHQLSTFSSASLKLIRKSRALKLSAKAPRKVTKRESQNHKTKLRLKKPEARILDRKRKLLSRMRVKQPVRRTEKLQRLSLHDASSGHICPPPPPPHPLKVKPASSESLTTYLAKLSEFKREFFPNCVALDVSLNKDISIQEIQALTAQIRHHLDSKFLPELVQIVQFCRPQAIIIQENGTLELDLRHLDSFTFATLRTFLRQCGGLYLPPPPSLPQQQQQQQDSSTSKTTSTLVNPSSEIAT